MFVKQTVWFENYMITIQIYIEIHESMEDLVDI